MTNLPVFAKSKGRGKQPKITNFFSKAQTATVSRIAKKVVMKTAETKSAYFATSRTLIDDIVYAQALNTSIPQGDTDVTREGNKILLKNLYIKGRINHYSSATVGNGTSSTRILLVRSNTVLTTTWASLTTTDIFRGTVGQRASVGLPDLNKITVLYDKTFSTNPTIQNSNQHVNFTINKKVMKNMNYESNTATSFKEADYYLVVVANKTDGSASNCAQIDCQWAVNFKDV